MSCIIYSILTRALIRNLLWSRTRTAKDYQLQTLITQAQALGGLEVWLFGSALKRADPQDLDVLLVYGDRNLVVALRSAKPWNRFCPPVSLIAMTRTELEEYNFVAVTGAVRIA